MASTIKVNNIQNQCGANIANKCGSTITLGASGDTITLACGASQTGFGRTGTVDWDTTAKTASFTAVSGNGYFVNTTSGAITVTLPAGSAGDIVSLADYAATWQTNGVTVAPNGTDKIGGINSNVSLITEGQSVTFVYTDSTQGWLNTMDSTSNVRGSSYIVATGGTITTCGDYKVHTFTGPDTFSVVNAGLGTPCAPSVVDYLVVAGGGGGTNNGSGGGGAGGFRVSNFHGLPAPTMSPLSNPTGITITATNYPITVGGGGAGKPCMGPGNPGSNSVFSTITSAGGGASQTVPGIGDNGGSGGGGHRCNTAGTGNTPPVSPPQGNNGNIGNSGGVSHGGGGGGAGGAGLAGGCGTGGGGGIGSFVSPTLAGSNGTTGPVGSTRYFAGGGGGGGGTGTPSPGGSGGGGDAGVTPLTPGQSGTANTGGGGGGAGNCYPCGCGGSGGSGIVIIRYKYQ